MSFTKMACSPGVALAFLTAVAGGCVAGSEIPAPLPGADAGGPGQPDGGGSDLPAASDGPRDRAADLAPDAAPAPDAAGLAPDAAGGEHGWDTSAEGAPGVCARDEDCLLVDDCCSCAAVGRGQPAPFCEPTKSCLMTTCAQYGGIDHARCVAGRCIVGFNCDTSGAPCNRQPPVCPPGQTPLAAGQGNDRCYGECVDARQCAAVPACSACAPGDLCLHTAGVDEAIHCVPWPQACVGPATCACAAASCVAPFATCTPPAPGTPGVVCTPS